MIEQGFPKLAIWNGPLNSLPIYREPASMYLPKTHRTRYNKVQYSLTNGELIFLVGRYGPFRDWITNTNFMCYYSVPLKAIEKGLISATSVYKWKTSYSILPTLIDRELTILSPEYVTEWMKNEGNEANQPKGV